MKTIEVVAAVMYNEDQEVFIAQRGDSMKYPGKWEFVGGKIENGESHEDALKRELEEEFGITVKVHEHLLTVNHKYPDFTINLHTYRVEWIDGEIHPHEHGDIAWVLTDMLDEYDLLEADEPIKEHIQEESARH